MEADGKRGEQSGCIGGTLYFCVLCFPLNGEAVSVRNVVL